MVRVLEVEYDFPITQAVKELFSIRKGDNSVTLTRKGLDIRGLRGLGKHLWKGEEAQEYVKTLRKEWDK